MELVLQGMSHKEIAGLTGMSEVGIGGIVRAPLFQEKLALRQKRREQIMDCGHFSGISAAKERLDDVALEKVEQLIAVSNGEEKIEDEHQGKAIHKLLDLAFNNDKAAMAGVGGNPLSGQVFQVTADRLEVFMQVIHEDRAMRQVAEPKALQHVVLGPEADEPSMVEDKMAMSE